MIKLDDITVALPAGNPQATPVLKNISLTIEDGEWLAVVGPNGSGKSTLLGTLAGLWPAASGSLEIPRAATVGLLLQEPDNQFVASSVRNELLLSLSPRVTDSARKGRVAEAVERFQLGEFVDRNPHELSGGEKQRLAMATVWLMDPQVLLLDEPTAYLDSSEQMRCVDFVTGLNRSGVTVVWATPGGDELEAARRVCYVERGSIVFDGPARGFAKTAADRKFDVMTPGRLPWGRTGGDSQKDRRRGGEPESEARRSAGAMASLRSVSFAYDGRDVLRDITAEIHCEEIIGISGANGSGKTTFLSILSGILQPTGGTVYRKYPRPIDSTGSDGKPEQRVFHMFQNPERLFFAETVFEEVAFGLKSLKVGKPDLPSLVSAALERADLSPEVFLDRSPFSLSLGEMRRLAFAMASALRPSFLLLDEPTSCLDAAGHRMLRDLLDGLRSDRRTVAIASHDISLLERLTDRILIVKDGGVTEAG
ncbi:MAG: ATP-binding cassette domain-containing protein [bacterium]